MSTHRIQIPKLGMDTTECDVIAWRANVGDRIEKGAAVLEVETEKATVEIEAPVSGVLVEIGAPAGSCVEVGAFVGTIEA